VSPFSKGREDGGRRERVRRSFPKVEGNGIG